MGKLTLSTRNRSGKTKPPSWGADRDRFHGNPNARRRKNRSGYTFRDAFARMSRDNPVAAYIAEHRRMMATGVAASHASAASLMKTYHPALVNEVMDRIGMHPSSEVELRALQRAY